MGDRDTQAIGSSGIGELRPLSIVHVAAPSLVGGLERVVQGLACGHHRQGHRVTVVSLVGPRDDDHPFPVPLREAGVTVHELRFSPKALLAERRCVRRLLDRIRPDIVHTHGYRPDLLHAPTARRLEIPTVTTEHGSSRLGGKAAFYEWLKRKAFRRFDAVVAVSSAIAGFLVREGVRPENVYLVPNGWAGQVAFLSRSEARRVLGLPGEGTVIAYVGRLIPAKGPDVFTEAFLKLRDLPVSGVVVGNGAERPRIEAMARAAGQMDRLRLVGHVDSAAPLFKAFDLFVLSSRTEGTPIVLLEAIAACVPTVVTAVGGVPDIVSERESWLVPSEDPSALAAAVREALADPLDAAERARGASSRLQREFSAELWLSRQEAVYRAVLGRTRG